MEPSVKILIKGHEFYDWNELNISKNLESVAGSFQFNMVQTEPNFWPISAGDSIQIFLEKRPILHGFVDFLGPDLSSHDRYITVSGRDNTCDLIDCTHKGQKVSF